MGPHRSCGERWADLVREPGRPLLPPPPGQDRTRPRRRQRWQWAGTALISPAARGSWWAPGSASHPRRTIRGVPIELITRSYGRAAAEALREVVAAHKRDDPLAPVTVVVPTNYVGVA